MKEVGWVTHYYPKIGVAVIELTAPLKVGDKIKIVGHTTDLEQIVKSMEIEHARVLEAKTGESIGLKTNKRVRSKDVVYKVPST